MSVHPNEFEVDALRSIFYRKKVVPEMLEPFGFRHTASGYIFQNKLLDSGFDMTVTVTIDGAVFTTITDPAFGEPYTLYLVGDAAGSFVGSVRTEYEELLTEISEKCFVPDVFQAAQAKELIEYVRETYGDELEYLWEKFPNNAVWRRKDTKKWYGALLTVSKCKLGIKSDEMVEIIDLRIAPEKMEALIDKKLYFPGWHMNKKNWYTVILDGSVSLEELRSRIDESYRLAIK